MTIEEQLKNEILNNYKSVRAFTQKIDIPYSTLDTIFKRGIGGVGVNTVLKIFNELSLDIESIDKGVLTHSDSKNSPVLTNKDIARVLGIDASTVSAKLNSYDRLKFSEAKAIRDNFFPTLQVEYLFDYKTA